MEHRVIEMMRVACGICLVLSTACGAWAQDTSALIGDEPAGGIDVTVRRWEEPRQSVPGSMSVISGETLQAAGLETVSDALRMMPNVTLMELPVKWWSEPYVRGVRAGLTTIIDGVPQFGTGNHELLGVERVEFLRGPQGSLYGGSAIGGVINVVPSLPTAQSSRHTTTSSIGGRNFLDTRGQMGNGSVLGSFSFGVSARDGYTTNGFTGDGLVDSNSAFGFGQVLWPKQGVWDLRLSLTAERDHDSGYGLDRPFGSSPPERGPEDSISREFAQPVFTAIKRGKNTEFTSITAFQWFKGRYRSSELTTGDNYYRRDSDERQRAYTQEFRLSPCSSVRINERLSMRWLAGAFLFRLDDDSASLSLDPALEFSSYSTISKHSTGISGYGQADFTLNDRWDLTFGIRRDYERRTADSGGAEDADPYTSDTAQHCDGSHTSPQVSVAYRPTPSRLWYATAAKGYRPGGFSDYEPGSIISDGEGTSWTYEAGYRMSSPNNRFAADLSLFHVAWEDMQVPMFGYDYAEDAEQVSRQGGELEVTYRPRTGLEFFGGAGVLHSDRRMSGGAYDSYDDQRVLPFAPKMTLHAGLQVSGKLKKGLRGFARVDVHRTSEYFYGDYIRDKNEGYTLTNVRIGAERGDLRWEAWADNVFDTLYGPVDTQIIGISPFMGQMGAPRTFGVSMSRAF